MNLRRFAWVTDPHLNFVDLNRFERFANELVEQPIDGILLTGDVSEAEDVIWQIRRIVEHTEKPVYFVLGNHDFYHSSIDLVRSSVSASCKADPRMVYLTGAEPILLSNDWSLCGDDGWADGRLGDYHRSMVRLNDYQQISDFAGLSPAIRLPIIRRLGLAAAVRIRRQLEIARHVSRRSVVLTHIPPFREACLYAGKPADDNWAPFFTCHSVGWMLRRFCQRYPEHQVLVLCGHTHHQCASLIADNLVVWTGDAEYTDPKVNAFLDLAHLDLAAPAAWSHGQTPTSNGVVRPA